MAFANVVMPSMDPSALRTGLLVLLRLSPRPPFFSRASGGSTSLQYGLNRKKTALAPSSAAW